MRKVIYSVLATMLTVVILFVIVPMIFGFNLVYLTEVEYNYDAISAVSTLIGGIVVPFFLVFLSAYITKSFDDSKKTIGESNIATLEQVEAMKDEIYKHIEETPKHIDGGFFTEDEAIKNKNLKDKAYKFIAISMFAKTHAVAEHLGVSDDEAFNILLELLRVDGKISAGGQVRRDNISKIIWTKK